MRWLTARTEPVLGDAGEVVRIHGTAQDVTERKQAEEQLRFQADLLDAVGEAVIATDLDGTVIYWGPGAEELYGWRAQEAQGRKIMDADPDGARAATTPPTSWAIGTGASAGPARWS